MGCSPHIQIKAMARYSCWIGGSPLRSKVCGEARRIRHDSMKQKLIRLSQRYVMALRKHLEQGPRASFLAALGLGRRAVPLGLEMLDMARIHERAVTTLELSGRKNGVIREVRSRSGRVDTATAAIVAHAVLGKNAGARN